MYSIDINFLKDRGIVQGPEQPTKPKASGSDLDKTPIYAGVGVGVLCLVLVGGFWFVANNQNEALKNDINGLEGKKGVLAPKVQEIEQLNAQTAEMNTQSKALAKTFDYIKPWSALLQSIRDSVPAGVQIKTIEQKAPKITPKPKAPPPPPPQPGAKPPAPIPPTPPPLQIIEISGSARSFNDVDDFLLALQQSVFFQPKETKILKAELAQSNPIKIQKAANSPDLELPPLVSYKIQTAMTDVPSSQLITEIGGKGAVGLESRIQKLKDLEVITP